jgi:hypothetical protein
VCPANWVEGASTIKPDPKGSLEYFQKEMPKENGEVDGGLNGHTNGSVPGSKRRGTVSERDDILKRVKHT